MIERVVLGGMAAGSMRLAERIRRTALDASELELSIDEVEEAAVSGASDALAQFAGNVTASARETAELFASVRQ